MSKSYTFTEEQLDFVAFMRHKVAKYPNLKSRLNACLDKPEGSLVTISHSPQKMIEFLSLFSRDDRFKWYTHKWDDFGSCTLEQLTDDQSKSKQILTQMAYPTTNGAVINEATYNQVWNFINFAPQSNYPWKTNKLKPETIGWHSIVEISKQNPQILPENIVLADGRLFIDYIRMFKASIEFRTDLEFDDKFSILISRALRNQLPMDFEINISERFREIGRHINVYCDIAGLMDGLYIICGWLTGFKSVSSEVSIDLTDETNYYALEIIHCNSYFVNIDKLKGLSGDFEKLRKRLFSVCDLTMEGDYYNGCIECKSLLVEALDEKTTMTRKKQGKKTEETLSPCAISEKSDKVGGVKYLIKIYKHR